MVLATAILVSLLLWGVKNVYCSYYATLTGSHTVYQTTLLLIEREKIGGEGMR